MPLDRLWAQSIVMNVRGIQVRVAALDDLMEPKPPDGPRLPPDREALLRTTLALSVDERVGWLEAMIAIALESGAAPKRLPDQVTSAGKQAPLP